MLVVLSSAYRHGITEHDMTHAISNALILHDQDDDRVIFVGPSTTGVLLEIGALPTDEGLVIFHAMTARPKFLPKG